MTSKARSRPWSTVSSPQPFMRREWAERCCCGYRSSSDQEVSRSDKETSSLGKRECSPDVLDSLLFMLFIDCVEQILPGEICYVCCADDVRIFASVENETDVEKIQKAITNTGDWASNMRLVLTSHSCGVLHLGSKNMKTVYKLNGITLGKTDAVKDLGARFSWKLNFTKQIQHVAK